MKAKLILVLGAAMLIAALASSQQTKFKLTHQRGDFAWAKCIVFNQDSSFWVNATYGHADSNAWGLTMLRWSKHGTLLSSEEFEKTDHLFFGYWSGCLHDINNNYYLGCEVAYPDPTPASPGDKYGFPAVIKYDLNADTVWVKHFPINTNRTYMMNSSRRTQNGNIIHCGSVSTTHPTKMNLFAMRSDTAGNLLWEKTYGVYAIDERGLSIEEIPDSSLVITGMRYVNTPQGAEYCPWIMKTDKNGMVQVEKSYTWPSMYYGGVLIFPSKFGGYWMQGFTDSTQNIGDFDNYPYIARLDDSFNILRRSFFNSKWATQIWDFYEMDNGNIVFCGDRTDSIVQEPYGYIAQIDSNGSLLWWQTYHESTALGAENYLSSVRPAPDGGFVACGSAFGVQTGTQDAWILKTDSMGCALVNCLLDVEELGRWGQLLEIYPNPARELINISLKGTVWEKGTAISAYDMTGKCMLNMSPHTGLSKISINISSWPAGVFNFVVRKNNGTWESRRVLIEK